MRFHVVALPHTQTNKEYSACAFTQKILKFVQMMASLGHEVYHYGTENNVTKDLCAEDVVILTTKEQEKFFGPHDSNKLYDLDWSGKADYWQLFNARVIEAINARKQSQDFLCIVFGTLQQPIAQATGLMAVETGIGYNGTFADYRVFESYSHMHRIWGQQSPNQDMDGKFYDVVIPNYFDPDDYPFKEKKSDYYLYLGRMVHRKGLQIAVDTCKQLGAKLIMAGQGAKQEGNKITCTDGGVYEGDNLKYVGCVMGGDRARLFQEARAVFTPTIYVEPFGGVAVEAQLAGTPAITSDWGAFPETVEHGKTGFRCRTLDQFVWAAKHVHELDPNYIHKRAVANYSMERIKWMYQEYFEMLSNLWGKGWSQLHPERQNLDWLRKY